MWKISKKIILGVAISMLIVSTNQSCYKSIKIEDLNADPPEGWNKTFGGGHADYGYGVQQTKDGGYVIVGSTVLGGANGLFSDVYLLKTDEYGNEQWNKTFGGEENDIGYSVQQTSDEGYIIVGVTRSYGAGGSDIYLIKTDAEGNVSWTKTYGGKSYDYSYSVEETDDGGYIVVGTTRTDTGDDDVYLIKTCANGLPLWTKTFGSSFNDFGWSVQQTSDGGYIIVGYTFSYDGWFDVYLIKTDEYGNEQWNRTFGEGAPIDDHGHFVRETSDGGYIIVGFKRTFAGGFVYLIKTDKDGNLLWEEVYGDYGFDSRGFSVQQTADGGYIIIGCTNSQGAGYYDVFLIKTDADGDVLEEKTFGGENFDEGWSAQETPDGGYIIVGHKYVGGNGFDPDVDIWLIKDFLDIVYVDDDFAKVTPGLGYNHFCKIEESIGAVPEGWMVFVCDGIYYENVVVDKSIDLIGRDMGTTVIDACGSGDVVQVLADRVKISGFAIRNSGSKKGDAGIEACSDYNIISENN